MHQKIQQVACWIFIVLTCYRDILEGKGKISSEQIERKVLQEYAIYNTRRLNTPLDDEIIDGFPEIEN